MLTISIIIPAYNAADTLTNTLQSIVEQTMPHWEAIVVNDGSTDETAAIASQFIRHDSRIQLVNQTQGGLSAARNTGIHFANADWLLFLDADDWIAPEYLETMFAKATACPHLDVIHCGYIRVAADGTLFDEKHAPSSEDLFPELARYCPFSPHACIVRKAIVQEVGEFDPFFYNCQDWDLWQRIARQGARFGAVPEVLAFYRVRENSLSKSGIKLFSYALKVIEQGHAADPRVPNPHPAYRNGMPAEHLSGLKFVVGSWCAGLVLGAGRDARPLLDLLQEVSAPQLDPFIVAGTLFDALPLARSQAPHQLWRHWAEIEPHVNDFLAALEVQSQTLGLADRTRVILESSILRQATAPSPITVGTSCAVQVEITKPINDIVAAGRAERLYCSVYSEGTRLGTLELPVSRGCVLGSVLADEIATRFSWKILGQFFENTIYRQRPGHYDHDQMGWLVFLQELWGRPDWNHDQFYDAETIDRGRTKWLLYNQPITVEVSADLPNIWVRASQLEVTVTVGGAILQTVSIPVEQNFVSAQLLRSTLTRMSGYELCRVCVREALLGRSIADPTPLRIRLAARASQTRSTLWQMLQRCLRSTSWNRSDLGCTLQRSFSI